MGRPERDKMNSKQLLESGQLSAAVTELTQEVKQRPADVSLRTFLFEVLCFAGEYDRAVRQLDVIGHQDEKTGVGVEVYRQLIRAESKRKQLFEQGLMPTFLATPPTYVTNQLDAISCLRTGKSGDAKRLLEESSGRAPNCACRVNGQDYASFRDSDDRTASVLEVFARDAYLWIPVEQVVKIVIPPPTHLRDLLWMPASVEVMGRPAVDVFLPVLYPESAVQENDQIRLGRMTDWLDLGDRIVGGIGQKVFLLGEIELALLEIREFEWRASA